MKPRSILADALGYNERLNDFIDQSQLPRVWFDSGIDHVAIKAYSPADYDDLIDIYRPETELIAETKLNGRRLAAAKLLGRSSLDIFHTFNDRPVGWLEIIESQPDDFTDKPVSFDHEEVYVPRGLIPIRTVLRRKQILYSEPPANLPQSWVSLTLPEYRKEVKFTQVKLASSVAYGRKSGSVKLL